MLIVITDGKPLPASVQEDLGQLKKDLPYDEAQAGMLCYVTCSLCVCVFFVVGHLLSSFHTTVVDM